MAIWNMRQLADAADVLTRVLYMLEHADEFPDGVHIKHEDVNVLWEIEDFCRSFIAPDPQPLRGGIQWPPPPTAGT